MTQRPIGRISPVSSASSRNSAGRCSRWPSGCQRTSASTPTGEPSSRLTTGWKWSWSSLRLSAPRRSAASSLRADAVSSSSCRNATTWPRPAGLGGVHRDVRVPEQVLARACRRGRSARSRCSRSTIGAASSSSIGWTQAVEQALADRRGDLRRLDVLEQDRELVAAEPAGRVAGPDDRPDPLGDDLERPVALGVPEPVVQVLEVVEVDEQHRGVVRAAAAQPRRARGRRGPGARAVRQAGQRVAVGELAQLVVQPRVVERDRRLADEQLGELDVALA